MSSDSIPPLEANCTADEQTQPEQNLARVIGMPGDGIQPARWPDEFWVAVCHQSPPLGTALLLIGHRLDNKPQVARQQATNLKDSLARASRCTDAKGIHYCQFHKCIEE